MVNDLREASFNLNESRIGMMVAVIAESVIWVARLAARDETAGAGMGPVEDIVWIGAGRKVVVGGP
jgi:hypothetical protein